MPLDHLAGGSFMEKAFPQGYVNSRRGVVVSCSRVELKMPGSSRSQLFFSFFLFFPFLGCCFL